MNILKQLLSAFLRWNTKLGEGGFASITHGGTLPDTSDKSDFYSLIDTATLDLTVGIPIGSSSASTGAFTTLSASGAVTLNGALTANKAVTINDDGANSILLTSDNDGTNHNAHLIQGGILAEGKHTLYVEAIDGFNQTNSDSALAKLSQLDADSTEPTLEVTHIGIAAGIEIGMTGNGSHLRLTGDPTVASPVDGDLWYTGSALNFYDGSSTTDLLAGGVGGSDTQVQYNDGGSIAGDAAMVWDKTADTLTISSATIDTSRLVIASTGIVDVADKAVVKITQDHASSSEPALEIDNDGTGSAIEIDAGLGNGVEIKNVPSGKIGVSSSVNNGGTHYYFSGNTTPNSLVEGQFWYDGTNLKFYDGSNTKTLTWT